MIVSALLTIALGLITLPLLKKLKFNQTILEYVSEHKKKNGTPTMGGIFFTVSAVICALIFSTDTFNILTTSIAIILGFFAIGIIDDLLKIKNSQNLGLTAGQKLFFQISISIIASIYAYKSGLNFMYLPFTNKIVNLSFYSIIINVITFIATVNGVNLLDGLDGLCASVSSINFLALFFIISIQLATNGYLYIVESEYQNLKILSLVFFGATTAYLLFNTYKASVFMGDTGSLSLGGALSTIYIFSGNTLYIPIIGVFYLISVLSVIIQVLYYKKTKKRVFLMAPYHHHLQQIGNSESKIAYVYTFITALISLICIYFIS